MDDTDVQEEGVLNLTQFPQLEMASGASIFLAGVMSVY